MKTRKIGHVSLTERLARTGDRLPIIGHIRKTRTRKSNILRGLGIILFWVAFVSLIPLIPALTHGEKILPFIVTFLITLIVSMVLIARYGASKTYHHTDGTMMVILLWIALFIVGMIPYLVAAMMGEIKCDFIDALFESVSGFTTVGASVFDNPATDLTTSMLLWRVLTQWIGGIIIVLLFMVILPMFVPGRRSLAKDDLQPLTNADGVQMKTIDVAKQFIIVYIVLTVIFAIVIYLASFLQPDSSGMRIEYAVQIALSTIAIGGFAPFNNSLVGMGDVQKVLIAIMMIISATNFYLHFRMAVKREMGVYLHDTEFKAMIVWYVILTLGIFLILKDKFIDGFFMVISLATTTGFVSDADFGTWEKGAVLLLALGMFIGGSSGSPAGGLKISRVLIMIKSIAIDAYGVINSAVVKVPKLNGKPISDNKVRNAYAVFVLFIVVIMLSTTIYVICTPMDIGQSLFTSISMISSTGTTYGVYASSFATMSIGIKLYTCLLMVFGRMEIIALLALFMPKFWIEVAKNGTEIRKQTDGGRVVGASFLDRMKQNK